MSSSYKKGTRPRRVPNSRPQAGKDLRRCPKCFTEHSREKCPYKEASCFQCGKKGHLKSVCLSKPVNRQRASPLARGPNNHAQVGSVFTCLTPFQDGEKAKSSSNIFCCIGEQIFIHAQVNGKELQSQWDTGSTCSMVRLERYCKLGSPFL